MLGEALEVYRAEAFKDDVARNAFLEHIQPLVRYCVERVVKQYGTGLRRNMDDVCSYVNVKLLTTWLPRYLKSSNKMRRVREAIKYLSSSVRGEVLHYVYENFDPRVRRMPDDADSMYTEYITSIDRAEISAAVNRLVESHLALRRNPDAVKGIVRKLADYLVRKEYAETGELPC